MKDKVSATKSSLPMSANNKWSHSVASNGMSSCSSSEENSADDCDDMFSDNNLQSTSSFNTSKKDGCHGDEDDVDDDDEDDDDDDGSGEPGKYNFRLLQEHCVQDNQGNKMYKCDICGGSYRHVFSLKRHYLRNHINYEYLSQSDIANCNINISGHKSGTVESNNSGSSSSSSSSGNGGDSKSERNVTLVGVYRCNICSHLFDRVAELKDHVLNHPSILSSKRFACKQCDMTFSHKQNLVRHLSVHSGEKPYACRHCGKGFPTATNQRRHERIHQGLKPYICIHCQSHFSQSGDLKKHIRKLHKEYFHQCAFCMKYFSYRSELEEHVVSHGKSLELNCKVLKRKIASSVDNKNNSNSSGVTDDHRRTSSQVRPSAPVVLPTTAAHLKSNVSEDIRKRFGCNLCSKRFHTNVKLQRHVDIVHQSRRSSSSNVPTSSTTLVVPRRLTRRSTPEDPQTFDGSRLIDPSPYFANVSQNIADNLQFYLDGKLPHRKADVVSKGSSPAIDFKLPVTENDWCSRSGVVVIDSLNSSGDSPVVSESETNSCVDADVLDLSMSKVLVSDSFCHEKSEFSKSTTMFLCHACGECFVSICDIEEHKVNNHPNVQCTHFEVENLKDVPLDLLRYQCSPVGALHCCPVVTTTSSDNTCPSNEPQPTCTKCSETFRTSSDLHEHILVCGGHIDCQRSHKIIKDSGLGHQSFTRRVVKRGMKRRLEMTDDAGAAVPLRRRCRKLRKEAGWDWLPVEQPQPQLPEVVKSVSERSSSSSGTCPSTTARSTPTNSVVTSVDAVLMCDGCNQKFKYMSALERHQKSCVNETKLHRTAQNERYLRQQQHRCKYCRRSFTYPASLKKHMSGFCSLKDRVKLSSSKKSRSYVEPDDDLPPPKLTPQKRTSSANFSMTTEAAVIDANTKTVTKEDLVCHEVVEAEPFEDETVGRVEEDSAVLDADDKVTAVVTEVEETTTVLVVPSPAPKSVSPPVVEKEPEAAVLVEDPPAVKREARSVGTSPCRIVYEMTELDCDKSVPKKEEPPKPIPKPSFTVSLLKPLSSSPVPSTSTTKDVVVKVESSAAGGSTSNGQHDSTRQESHHTCPNCKRTFTYLANFKKHLNVLCPLRSMNNNKNGSGQEASSNDQQQQQQQKNEFSKVDGNGESDKVDASGNGANGSNTVQEQLPSQHKCSICHEMFSEYVEMLKHRISHKLKTAPMSITSGGIVPIQLDNSSNSEDAEEEEDDEVVVTRNIEGGQLLLRCRSDSSSSDEPLIRRASLTKIQRNSMTQVLVQAIAGCLSDDDGGGAEDEEDVDNDLEEVVNEPNMLLSELPS